MIFFYIVIEYILKNGRKITTPKGRLRPGSILLFPVIEFLKTDIGRQIYVRGERNNEL